MFTDLEAFAASDAFDAAYIASPNLCHFDQAMCLLLRHGKHVLLEKPGVLTRKQTETLVETANANHVVYLEAMRLVFDDALPIIRDALPEIGTLRRVTAEFTQYSSRYDRVRAGEPHINAFDPALCNAAILDMGCYPIHALISMFGEPAHVSAEAYHLESGFEAGGIALCAMTASSARQSGQGLQTGRAHHIHGRGRLDPARRYQSYPPHLARTPQR